MRIPGYVFHNVGSLQNDPRLDVVHGLILHVDGGNATSLWHWFDGPSGGIESHVFIPKGPEHDKEQFRDTTREADANYKANSWLDASGKRHGFLSAETQGYGSGKWTKYQLDEIKDLILVTAKEHQYPLKPVGSYHGKGVGYHTQYPAWTNVPGKTCPGAGRIQQYHDIIVPWLAEQRDAANYYVTVTGDTAFGVAHKYGITVSDLWRWNPNVAPPFKAGTKLRITKPK